MPEPAPAPGRALVRVRAAGLNPVDLAIASGRFYLPLPDPPFVSGAECMGEVVSSATLPEGTRVWCLPVTGGFAEIVSVPEESLVPVPDRLGDVTAGGLGVAGLAGWMSVRARGRLAPGETVVVLGAGGVVGQIAVQAARIGGAAPGGRRRPQRAGRERALARGADVALSTGDGLPDALRAACGEGADLVIDALWGDSAAAAHRRAAPRRPAGAGGQRRESRDDDGGRSAARAAPRHPRPVGASSRSPASLRRAYAELAEVTALGEVALEVEAVPSRRGAGGVGAPDGGHRRP